MGRVTDGPAGRGLAASVVNAYIAARLALARWLDERLTAVWDFLTNWTWL